jgi:hypothetical protein
MSWGTPFAANYKKDLHSPDNNAWDDGKTIVSDVDSSAFSGVASTVLSQKCKRLE